MNKYKLTGHVNSHMFSEFLSKEIGADRRNIKLFTKELKKTFNVEFLSLVNSGSSANLVAALIVKEIKTPKNKILLSAFTFPTTISAYSLLGFNVELIDIEKDTFNMSVKELKEHVDNDTAAVVVTHFLGFPAKLKEIKEICDKHNVLLIQDACETMNLKYKGQSIHSYGSIITHSFYHPHHLSSYGGGAVIVDNEDLYTLSESIIHWGRLCKCHIDPNKCTAPKNISHNFYYVREGLNVEISELNACFGRYQLQSWEQQELNRKKYYHKLYNKLKKFSFIRVYPDNLNISPFVFPIKVLTDNFDEIISELQEKNIEIRNLMGGAIYLQPAFKHLNNGRFLLNAKSQSDNTFFLGIHQYVSSNDFETILTIIEDIFSRHK